MVMTPDEKRAQFATRDSRAYVIASTSWAMQVGSAKATEFDVRVCCHSGVTKAIAELIAEDYERAGWTVTFIEETPADPQRDAPHTGSVLIYSLAPT